MCVCMRTGVLHGSRSSLCDNSFPMLDCTPLDRDVHVTWSVLGSPYSQACCLILFPGNWVFWFIFFLLFFFFIWASQQFKTVLRRAVWPYMLLKGKTIQDSCKVFCERETKLNMIFSLVCTRAEVGQILWTCEEIWACVHLQIIFLNCTICLKPYICNIEAIYSHTVQNNAYKTSLSTCKCTLAYRIIMHVGTYLLLCYFQNYIVCLLDYVLFKWNG